MNPILKFIYRIYHNYDSTMKLITTINTMKLKLDHRYDHHSNHHFGGPPHLKECHFGMIPLFTMIIKFMTVTDLIMDYTSYAVSYIS